jgi:hypothetical protein
MDGRFYPFNSERWLRTRGSLGQSFFYVAMSLSSMADTGWSEEFSLGPVGSRLSGSGPTPCNRRLEPSQAGVIKAPQETLEASMNGLIYLVGLIVVILAVLSFFGLR